jgi:hypothetical protein
MSEQYERHALKIECLEDECFGVSIPPTDVELLSFRCCKVEQVHD